MDQPTHQENIAEKVFKQLHVQNKWKKLERTKVRGKQLIIGHPKTDSISRHFYPLSSKSILSFRTLRAVIEHSKQDCLTLAIQDEDSTTVFYNSRLGLHPPNIPDRFIINETIDVATSSEVADT